ncbi:MAG: class IIb bacteriocin, lactobin A/cerein 7B family [Flavobacteriaceae bacterium]|nr:class IIb bacteriocin, lactobin A/cerein 7B family [Flavobacteriaceae bacterium]
MGDLKEYGVQEMSAKEMESVDGGWLRLLALVVAAVIYDWEHFKDGLLGRVNKGNKCGQN